MKQFSAQGRSFILMIGYGRPGSRRVRSTCADHADCHQVEIVVKIAVGSSSAQQELDRGAVGRTARETWHHMGQAAREGRRRAVLFLIPLQTIGSGADRLWTIDQGNCWCADLDGTGMSIYAARWLLRTTAS